MDLLVAQEVNHLKVGICIFTTIFSGDFMMFVDFFSIKEAISTYRADTTKNGDSVYHPHLSI